MRLAVIGSGYVGLVSGACFADFGHHVVCVDTDADRIQALGSGRMPIFEVGLDELVCANLDAGRLSFTTDLAGAVAAADVVFIAVGTPSRRGDGQADLRHVYAATSEIGRALQGYTVVVTKSTVPVGTGDQIEQILRNVACDAAFDVASNPEFLREGAAINDFKRPDRILIGAQSERAVDILREVYRPLYLNETPIVVTSRRTAELTKYAANAFLATKIAFINEMADLCQAVGGNVQHVAKGIGLDKRIGPNFLNAGPGFGGSCFPKDTRALAWLGRAAKVPLSIVDATVASNDRRKASMADLIIEAAGGDVSGRRIAVLGLTFKPNTDDMREAASLSIIPRLLDAGAIVTAYDPKAHYEAAPLLPEVRFAPDAYSCGAGAHVIVLMTEWDEFRALDLDRLAALMNGDAVVDLRNIYSRAVVEAAGLSYTCIGRPAENTSCWIGEDRTIAADPNDRAAPSSALLSAS